MKERTERSEPKIILRGKDRSEFETISRGPDFDGSNDDDRTANEINSMPDSVMDGFDFVKLSGIIPPESGGEG